MFIRPPTRARLSRRAAVAASLVLIAVALVIVPVILDSSRSGPPGSSSGPGPTAQSGNPDPVEEAPTAEGRWAEGESTVEPRRSLQSIIDRTSPGEVVEVPPGVYRESVRIVKPITLIAAPGVEIRGSDVWDQGWTPAGDRWISDRSVPDFGPGHGTCLTGSRCTLREQVYLDGNPLEQVEADPESGEFALMPDRRIVLADDPDEYRMVEVTTRSSWVVAESGEVSIEGFTMRHAANDAQTGAITNGGYDNWTIHNNRLFEAHGANVSLRSARHLRLTDNLIARGGQSGVHGTDVDDMAIAGNRIESNNTAGFSPGWEAGGVKVTNSRGVVFRENDVVDNQGPGIWCDIDCDRVTVTGNRVAWNSRSGILYELSRNGSVRGNAVWENGHGHPDWGWGAGILIQNSRDTEVAGNVVAWNADGISVISQERAAGTFTTPTQRHDWNEVVNNRIADNEIFVSASAEPDVYALAWLEDWNGTLFDDHSNNLGESNSYFRGGPERGEVSFYYNGETYSWMELDRFGLTRGEQNANVITAWAKDEILTAAGIPLVPSTGN